MSAAFHGQAPPTGAGPARPLTGATRARRGRLRLAAMLGAVMAVGCFPRAPVVVDFGPPARHFQSGEYREVYDRWTRHGEVLYDTATVLEAWATFRSREFREAFVDRYAAAYQLGAAETARLRQTQESAAATGYDFIVTTQSNEYRWNDLDKSNSPWRATLIDGAGHSVSSDEIREERFPDLFQEAFYPAKTPFSKTFSIHFNQAPEHNDAFPGVATGSITLRLAGPLGHLDLVWQAQPAP